MRGLMYHPALRRALLEKLARWGSLPRGDLYDFLSPVDRLRYRPEVLADIERMGLVHSETSGDESMIAITPEGREWLATSEGETPT